MTTERLTRAERQAQTRQRLLDAGAEVVAERGFHAASVELIAERAGFTRGAFYSNFATKEELFFELLQQRVYEFYTRMVEAGPLSPREAGEKLAAVQAHRDGRWMFVLWLELIAQAGRDPRFREFAAEFWRGNRKRLTDMLGGDETMASMMIAMDIGLAMQHFVDPEGAPLSLYADAYERLSS